MIFFLFLSSFCVSHFVTILVIPFCSGSYLLLRHNQNVSKNRITIRRHHERNDSNFVRDAFIFQPQKNFLEV